VKPAAQTAPAVSAASVRPSPSRALLGLAVASTVLIWTFNFVIAKRGLERGGIDALTLASFRVVLAALIMAAAYLPAAGKRASLTRGDLWTLAPLGLFGVALNQVLFTVGLNYTTVGHSSLIIGSGPITILLMAWLMRLERLTVKKILGMLLSFAGVAVLAAEHGFHFTGQRATALGDLITLLGSLAFAAFAVLGKKLAGRYDSTTVNACAFFTGGLLVLPLAVWQALRLDWGAVRWEGWVALLYMATMASVTAYVIWYWTLRHMSAARLAAFGYLQPLLATSLGVLVLGEALTSHLLLGGTLVIVGVVLAELGPREESPARY